jgi:hypothetical protein
MNTSQVYMGHFESDEEAFANLHVLYELERSSFSDKKASVFCVVSQEHSGEYYYALNNATSTRTLNP